jgi:hypothetical protein
MSPPDLILDSLEIRGFRAFQHLVIPRLAKVNLITGKNNVGKTCLLEALSLYAGRGSLLDMRRLLESRGETGQVAASVGEGAGSQSSRYLFFGRKHLDEQGQPIRIGPKSGADLTLSVEVIWYREQIDAGGQRQWILPSSPTEGHGYDRIPGLEITLGTRLILRYPLEIDIPHVTRFGRTDKVSTIPCSFVYADGLGKEQASLWDRVALTDLKNVVLESLRIIAADIQDVNLVGIHEGNGDRIPMVRVSESAVPLPLKSVGEGVNRLFGITLALVTARNGMLLIDEVESGLHYSVQTDLWRLIFRVAERLNVQVFATTHSWDCIKGFQEAARETSQDGLLISLRQKKDQPEVIVPVLYGEEDLAIATQQTIAIEVR